MEPILEDPVSMPPSATPPAELTPQLRKLHHIIHTTTETLDATDTDNSNSNMADMGYQGKLQNGIMLRKSHLRRAKEILVAQQERINRARQLDGRSYGTKEVSNGIMYTNDRVPYHFERGDLIGVSMASVKLQSQVQQSLKVVKSLELQRDVLDEKIEGQKRTRRQLEELVKALKNRAGRKEEKHETELEKMERLVEEERKRSRLLRDHARELRTLFAD